MIKEERRKLIRIHQWKGIYDLYIYDNGAQYHQIGWKCRLCGYLSYSLEQRQETYCSVSREAETLWEVIKRWWKNLDEEYLVRRTIRITDRSIKKTIEEHDI